MLNKTILLLPIALISFASMSTVAGAMERRDEQAAARAQMMAGKAISIRSIENRVLPRMRDSEYLGFRYFDAENIYRLRFLKAGRVTEVDVDGQTGNILGQR